MVASFVGAGMGALYLSISLLAVGSRNHKIVSFKIGGLGTSAQRLAVVES